MLVADVGPRCPACFSGDHKSHTPTQELIDFELQDKDHFPLDAFDCKILLNPQGTEQCGCRENWPREQA